MKTILLIDDDAAVLTAMEEIVGASGYKTVVYPEAATPLSAIRAGMHVDLVITDHQMPDMNGVEFVAALRTVLPSVPVIMLTAQGSVDLYVTLLSLGVFEYFHKPVVVHELLCAVQSALESSQRQTGQG